MARASRAEWIKRVQRWRDSGLTALEYAAETGLNANTLQNWGWRLKSESGLGRSKLTAPGRSERLAPRSTRAGRSKAERVPVVEVVGATMASAPVVPTASFELVVGGVVVRVPAIFDGDSLRQLLSVLESR